MKKALILLMFSPFLIGLSGCTGDDSTEDPGQQQGDAGSNASDAGSDGSVVESGMDSSTPVGSVITTVTLRNSTSAEEAQVPLTFGQVFRPGDVPKGASLRARVGSSDLPTQVDIKARHADGSLRHGIITVVATIPAGGSVQAVLVTIPLPSEEKAIELEELLKSDFNASLTISLGSKVYSLDAKTLLGGKIERQWLSGPLVSEWIVSGSPTDGQTPHPHLYSRFSVRAYAGMKSVRVGLSVDNDWAFEPEPQNFTYDVSIKSGAQQVYSLKDLEHYRRARWRQVFWWGDEVHSQVGHDGRYLMDSGALPHFDPQLEISESELEKVYEQWSTLDTGPMGIGPMEAYMPGTGAHDDIGPLSRWDALYLCSMDSRAQQVAMGLGDLAGSWPIHYRDKDTGMPVRLDDYPYMSLLGNPGDLVNPKTGKSEAFAACSAEDACKSPYQPDSSHQPSLAYLPYVVGGDYDHLEELMFWANFNMLESNPHYRNFEQGWLKWGQVRGQAWSLRTLGFAAYIVPDDHPFKTYFNERLGYNLQYYLDRYTKDEPNALGVFTDGYAFAYNEGRGIAPWQDDFFTWSVGQLVAMGFDQAVPLLEFKAKFSVGRMTDPGFCHIHAAAYQMNVRDEKSAPMYETFAEVYEKTVDPAIQALPCASEEMGKALQLKAGELTGYSSSAAGYPSNMQPALAVAVESGIPNAKEAWELFEQRPVKPDYTTYPNWAITPRTP